MVRKLTHLHTLELRSNNLHSMPPELFVLKLLVKVDLSGNKLQTIPSSYCEWENITTFDLSGNPIVSIPNSVLHDGAKAVIKFLKSQS